MFYKNPKFIKIENTISTINSRLVNNLFSNWLKEFFEVGQSGTSLYLYCDATDQYLANIPVFKKGKETEITIVEGHGIRFAVAINHLNRIQRYLLLKNVNHFFNGNLVFRYKRIMTVNSTTEGNR